MKPHLNKAGQSPFPGSLESIPSGSCLSLSSPSHGGDRTHHRRRAPPSSALGEQWGRLVCRKIGAWNIHRWKRQRWRDILEICDLWCLFHEFGCIPAPGFQETPTTQRRIFHKIRQMSLIYDQIIQIQKK